MRHIPLILLTVLATACAKSEPADQISEEALNAAGPAPQTDGALAEDPVTPGSWEASAQGESQAVIFRGPEGERLFSVACDLRGGLVVQRPGLIARGNLALMQLRTADVVRRLAVNAAAGEQPQVEARAPYNDQLTAALLSFDEPLEVRYEGQDTLLLPPSPVVGDLVRTCQQVGSASGQAPVAAQNEAEPEPAPAQNQQ